MFLTFQLIDFFLSRGIRSSLVTLLEQIADVGAILGNSRVITKLLFKLVDFWSHLLDVLLNLVNVSLLHVTSKPALRAVDLA